MKIDQLDLQVFFGTITDGIVQTDNPIILVSTSYDSISIAPQATKGVSHLSGMFAMNEISKLIRKLNSDTDLNLVEK